MQTVPLNSSKGRWIMVSAILASAMAFIDSTALNVVLPSLQKDLDAKGADIFWILNAYLLILASLILVGGSLGDKLGRKKIFMAGILIFIIGSALCGAASGVFLLIIFRIIQGIGGALMIPGSLALISSSIAEKERGKAIGTWSAVTTLVTIGGPILGGALADAGLWRYIFFINLPIGVIALAILHFKVDEVSNPAANKSIDAWGATTVALGLALLTFGFLRVPVMGIGNWQSLASIILGMVLLAIFVVIEKRNSQPMMPLSLFRNKTFAGANLLTFFLYAGLGASMLFLSLNLVQIQGYTQLQSGLTFLPFTVLMIMVARFAGTLADKYGPRLLLIIGPAAAGAGMLMLSFVEQTHGATDYWHTFFPGIVVFGLGMSFTVAPLTTAVMASAKDELSGAASGVNNAMTRVANVFANAIFGALAMVIFSVSVQQNLTGFKIPQQQQKQIMAATTDLGNAKPPKELKADVKTKVENIYHQSFIHSYRIVLQSCAGLAFLSAVMTVIFIDGKKHRKIIL